MLDQNDFLELALSRDGSEITKNRIRRLIKHRMANPAKGQHHKHHIAPNASRTFRCSQDDASRIPGRHFHVPCVSLDVGLRRRIMQGDYAIRQFKTIRRITEMGFNPND